VLALTGVSAAPSTVTPDGDGVDDTATIAYELTAPATVTVTAVDETGAGVSVVEPARWRRAGSHTATFDPSSLADGRYSIVLDARDAQGATATAETQVVVTRLLGGAEATPALFSPNGDGRADRLRVAFALDRAATVAVRVLRGDAAVTTVFRGPLGGGRHAVRWDGSKANGRVGDGGLSVLVEARDALGPVRVTLPLTVDTTPPRLRLASRRPPRLVVDEAVGLRLVVNGASRRVTVDRARVMTLPGVSEVRTMVADAWDLAGNRTTLRVRRPGASGQ